MLAQFSYLTQYTKIHFSSRRKCVGRVSMMMSWGWLKGVVAMGALLV